IALAADDRTIACGFKDGMLQIWDTDSKLPLTPLLAAHKEPVICVVFSSDQQKLLSSSDDCTFCLWSRTGALERTFSGHTDTVHSVAFSSDDTKIASASLDATAKIWDALTGDLLQTSIPPCSLHRGPILRAAFSPDDKTVFSGSDDRHVRIWNGSASFPPFLHNAGIVCIQFSQDDTLIASGTKDGTIYLWDTAIGELHGTLSGEPHEVISVKFSPD
ncbi:WD40-repeat-containing domain protein, partial [Mycena rosella]